MEKTFKYEIGVGVLLLVVLMTGVLLSGLEARRDKRDGNKRAELREMKRQIEIYYNENGQYPSEWTTGQNDYVVVEKDGERVAGWYISGKLERKDVPEAGFDEEYNIEWRVTREGRYEICGGGYVCK